MQAPSEKPVPGTGQVRAEPVSAAGLVSGVGPEPVTGAEPVTDPSEELQSQRLRTWTSGKGPVPPARTALRLVRYRSDAVAPGEAPPTL
jgi:hypothetical protein